MEMEEEIKVLKIGVLCVCRDLFEIRQNIGMLFLFLFCFCFQPSFRFFRLI